MIKKFIPAILINLFIYSTANARDAEFWLNTPVGLIKAEGFSTYSYVSFNLNRNTEVSLISSIPVKNAEISPLKYKIPFRISGDSIILRLDKPGNILVRINDSIKVFLFAGDPELLSHDNEINIVSKYGLDLTGMINETQKMQQALDEISGSGKVLYFPPGFYKSDQLRVRSNTKIRLSRGAVINADTSSASSFFSTDNLGIKRFIYMNGAKNVEITGYGTINGNGHILRRKFGDDARMRLILAANSENIRIEGLTLKDPGSWNTQVILCDSVIIRNVKLLNDIDLSNTDGFDPDASGRVLIENCFAYCSDDNVAVKTTGSSGLLGDVDGVMVKGCVFMTKKSALKVGTETRSKIMRNITFENNDVLECDRGMALYVSDGASLDNIKFLNNRFERNYPDAQRKAIHFLVNKRNPESKLGTISNVLVKDCIFYSTFPRKSVIKYEGEGNGIDVKIDNLVIGGQKVESLETGLIESTNSNVLIL